MKYILLCLSFLSFQAFAGEPKTQPSHGTYSSGQKAVKKTNGHSSSLELKLNDDKTFQYYNETNPKKTDEFSGTWEIQGKYILLKSNNNSPEYPTKWKLDQNYPCVKTRIGMEFIRICNCTE